MSLHRSRLHIYRELLTQVYNGRQKPTRMMYSTELPWPAFNQVIKDLVSQGYLAEEKDQPQNSSARYRITEKGKRFLEYVEKAMTSVDVIEEIQSINLP